MVRVLRRAAALHEIRDQPRNDRRNDAEPPVVEADRPLLATGSDLASLGRVLLFLRERVEGNRCDQPDHERRDDAPSVLEVADRPRDRRPGDVEMQLLLQPARCRTERLGAEDRRSSDSPEHIAAAKDFSPLDGLLRVRRGDPGAHRANATTTGGRDR